MMPPSERRFSCRCGPQHSCLCCLMGRAAVGADSWLLFESHLPGSSFKTNSVTHWNRPGICFRWGSAAPVVFCETWWDGVGFVVPNSNPIFQPFPFLQSFSCSYQTVFRAVKTPRSIKPCQVLLKPLQKAGAENKSNRSRPVEHGDAVGVDVTSCFTVWVCFQVEPWLNMKSPQQNQVVVLLPLVSLRRSPAPFKQNNPKQMYVVESKEGHKQEWN